MFFNLFKKPKVTEQIYNKFIDTGKVDESILRLIAVKVIESKGLSDWEWCIFTDKTEEINEIIIKIAKK